MASALSPRRVLVGARGLVRAAGDALLDEVTPEEPERQGAKRRLSQQPVEPLDLPEWPPALPEHTAQHTLVLEVGKRALDEACRPEVANER